MMQVDDSKHKRFFIIGCQRSGTTLLRLILDSHSKILCLDETMSYNALSDVAKLKNIFEDYPNKKWIGYKTPRITEQINFPVFYDYGLTNSIPNTYDNEPLLFIVRDCRDVVCSMKNLRTSETQSWLESWCIPILTYWIDNSPNFRKEFDKEIQEMKKSNYQNIAAAALYWKFKNSSFFRYEKLGYPIIKIKYEELVTSPKPVIENLLKFLNLEWEESVLAHNRLYHLEVDQNGFTVGNTNAHMPISDFHVGQYHTQLNHEEIESIISIVGKLMNDFGYD
jgi:hypothetical protein